MKSNPANTFVLTIPERTHVETRIFSYDTSSDDEGEEIVTLHDEFTSNHDCGAPSSFRIPQCVSMNPGQACVDTLQTQNHADTIETGDGGLSRYMSSDRNTTSSMMQDDTTTNEVHLDKSPRPKSAWRERRARRKKAYIMLAAAGTMILVLSIVVGFIRERKSTRVGEGPSNDSEGLGPTTAPGGVPGGVPWVHEQGNDVPQVLVLERNQFLERGDFVISPSGNYAVGLDKSGNFLLKDKISRTIWSAATTGATRVYLQPDGNLIVKDSRNHGLWSTRTYGNNGATLVVDDGGRIAIVKESTAVWFAGIPRRNVQDPSPASASLSFPTRAIFYYPWFPETWTVNGHPPKFESTLGEYSSSDPMVARAHIDALNYAHIDLSIASWWGPDTNLDRARLTMLMDETIQMNSSIKWTVYYEQERVQQPASANIRQDLDYLKKWFTWHPTWARVDGRPLIFVYNEAGCDIVKRWMDANDSEWYVVIKIFGGFLECPQQPDDWHQYGVHDGKPLEYDHFSFSIAPGFWRADRAAPDTPRVSRDQWCENAELMSKSQLPWHLIISFNEAGEGTNIEPSPQWSSDTKYGYYLDCLHRYPTIRTIG